MNDLKITVDRLNAILKKNDLTLINEFEEEFIKLEYEKESSGMIIYGNRQLIRNSYYLIVLLYGEKATLYDFKTLINDHNGRGRKMVMEISKMKFFNKDIEKEKDEIITWMLYDYYSGISGRRNCPQTYTYCLPARYLIDKMVNIMNIEKNIYSNKEKEDKYLENNASKDEDIVYADKNDFFEEESKKAKTQSKTVIGHNDIIQDIGEDISFDEIFEDLI